MAFPHFSVTVVTSLEALDTADNKANQNVIGWSGCLGVRSVRTSSLYRGGVQGECGAMEPPPETRVAADGIKPFKRPWYRIKWNYYRSMWTYGLVCSLLGAIILAAIEDYPFIDCLFLSVSAYTGSGLVTIASDELSSETFVILFCIMLAGTTVTLLLLPMIWRIQVFNSLEPQTALVLKSVEHLIETPRVRNMLSLLSSRRAQVRGLRVVASIVVLYLFLCLVGGWLVLWLILHFTEPVPELLNRFNSSAPSTA
eukprot:1630133-Rhodomonas_salina.1